jgi:hypothetical protein
MIKQQGLENRLSSLSGEKRVSFAAACSQHTITFFEELRGRDEYSPSRSDMFLTFLEVLEEIWANICGRPSASPPATLEQKLDSMIGEDFAAVVTYVEGELLDATSQTLECLKSNGSLRRALLAAKQAYNAMSKWFVAKSFPGRAMRPDQIAQFETDSPECQVELGFQLSCMSALEQMNGPAFTYDAIIAFPLIQ